MTHPVDPRQPHQPQQPGVPPYGDAGAPAPYPAAPPPPHTPPVPPQYSAAPPQAQQPYPGTPPHQQYPATPPQQPYTAAPPQQPPYAAAPPHQPPYAAAPPHQQYPATPPQQPYAAAPPQQPYTAAPQQPPYAAAPPQPGYPAAPPQQPYQSAAGQSAFAPPQQAPVPPQQAPYLSAPPQQPGAEHQHPAPPPYQQPYDPSGPVRIRRGADSSSVTILLLNLPLFLGSLLVVWLLSQALPEGLGTVFVIAWLASGALMFHRPTERALAKLYFRMRPPTGAELAVLQPIWEEVTRQAGVDGSAYDLWMEDTDELNAYAGAGHIVGVTRGAMSGLPPEHLAAILAHELGHHVGGHAWAGLLGAWYALPARVFMLLMKAVLKILFFVTAELSCLAVGIFVAVVGALAIATFLAFPPAVALYAIPFLLAWAGRQGELRADRFAGQIGYGPMLLSIFTTWQGEGHDDEARKQGALTRLMSTHPSFHQRIRALETFVS